MTEKLDKNESIAKVYMFLSDHDNWKTDADRNKDDVIIHAEFKSYMLQFEKEWNGEHKYDSNDIINKFWNSVDVNKAGKSASVKGNNKNALDTKELANVEKNIAITNAIKDLFNVEGFKCPTEIKNKDRWRNSMIASLLNKAQGYTGSLEEQSEIIAYLKPLFNESVAKTNADCIKDQIMQDAINNIKSKPEFANIDYPYMDDTKLNKIINNYIKSLSGTESFEDVCDSIECLIKDYLATAGIGNGGTVTSSSTAFDVPVYDENGKPATDQNGARRLSRAGSETTSTERLTQYGYDGYSLNDLQKAVLTVSMNTAIDNALSNDSTYKSFYTDNKADFKDVIDSYIDAKLSSASSDDFNSLKAFNGTTFIAEKAGELDSIKSQISETNTKRDALITKVQAEFNKTDENSKDRKEAITKVFGASASSANGISEVIKKLSASEIAAKEAEFDAEIAPINARISASDFFKNLKSSYTVVAGGSVNVATLPTYYGTHSTGTLGFTSSNSSVIDVDASGNVTVKGGSTAGKYMDAITISVTDKTTGAVLASYTVTEVNVLPDLSSDTTIFNDKNNHAVSIESILASESAIVNTAWYDNHLDDLANDLKTNISGLLDNIGSALKRAYPENATQIDNAIKTTKSYYSAICNALCSYNDNHSEKKTAAITFQNYVTGKTNDTATASWGYKANESHNNVNNVTYIMQYAGDSGIFVGDDIDNYSSDQYYVWYDEKAVIQKFLSFFGQTR